MFPNASSIQAIVRFSLLSFLSWETCTLNLIEKYQPSSVSFFCNSPEQCPSSDLYKLMRIPSQTVLGLEHHQLPNFTNTDFVFWIEDNVTGWDNETVWKYRLGGKNDFKIVVVANNGDEGSLRQLFQAMWKAGVVYSAVLLKNDTGSKIYTYIPFRSGYVCEDTSPVLLGACEDSLESTFDMSRKIFDLNNCTIRIAASDDRPWLQTNPLSGRLRELILELASRMNFSFEIMEPLSGRNGGMCGPEEFTGSKGDVVKGKAHLAAGSFASGPCSVLAYITLPHISCYSWCTPIMTERGYILYFLTRQFQPEVWIFLVVTLFVVTSSILVLSSVSMNVTTSNDMFYILCALFVQVPLEGYRTTPLKLIIGVWLFVCLVVRSAYEGELKSLSAVPVGAFVIRNLRQLAESQMQLCGTSGSLQQMNMEVTPIVKLLISKTTVCNDSLFENIKSAALKKDRAIYTADTRCSVSSSEINFKESLLYSSTGGCVRTLQFTTIVILPGSPFKKHLQQLHNQFFDAGLIKKWLDLRPGARQIGQVKAYTITQFLPALFILLVGCFFGLILFMAEIIYYRKSMLSRSKYKKGKESYAINSVNVTPL